MKKLQVFDKIAFFRADDDCSLLLGGRGSYKKINEYFDDIYFLPQLQGYQVAGGQNGFVAFTNFENLKIFYESKLVYDTNSMSYLANCNDTFLVENEVISCIVFFDVKKNNFGETTIKHWGKNYFSNDFLFVSQKEDIISYSLQNFHPLWQYALPDGLYDGYNPHFKQVKKAEISKIIGVYDGVLWVALNTGWLLGLDVVNGTEQHTIRQPSTFEQLRIFISLYTQLDSEKGVLFGLRNTHYWEIDLEKEVLSYQIYDISSSFQQFKIRAEMPIYDWIWLGNEIFFGEIYDADHRQDTNTVGIFDRTKREIIWADRIGKKGEIFPTVQKIDYAEQRLYVLDGECTLHVFEREA